MQEAFAKSKAENKNIFFMGFASWCTHCKKMQEVIAMTPLKKIGKPEDIAKVVAMLIDNEFMTGETIDVNGGLYMD